MRIAMLAAVAAIGFSACGQGTETVADAPVEPAPAADTPTAMEHDAAGHGTMDSSMAAADTADDANTAETPDGFTFHTYPNKTEAVHLPAGSWTASTADTTLVSVGAGADETMPDGSVHHVVRVNTLGSGNAVVKFERREGADPAAAPAETRNVNFMIH
jgi:ABC-type glycerol-3-phosphate transport system substrate-binding protein